MMSAYVRSVKNCGVNPVFESVNSTKVTFSIGVYEMEKFIKITKTYHSGEIVFKLEENHTREKPITHIFETEKEAEDYKDFLLNVYGRKEEKKPLVFEVGKYYKTRGGYKAYYWGKRVLKCDARYKHIFEIEGYGFLTFTGDGKWQEGTENENIDIEGAWDE